MNCRPSGSAPGGGTGWRVDRFRWPVAVADLRPGRHHLPAFCRQCANAFRNPQRTANRSTPDMVAETIHFAATDPAERVLYLSGRDGEMLLSARAATDWPGYAAMMRTMMGL